MTVGVLLLAAGRARRFGADKRLARLPDGPGMLMATATRIIETGLPLLVCLAPGDDGVGQSLGEQGIACRLCPDAANGMGATLANGIAAIESSWSGVLVALADMPYIAPRTYSLVAETLAPGGIAVPCCRGRRGHPVAFDRAYFPQLRALGSDRGARDIVAAHPEAVRELTVGDAGVLVDIDVPADLRAAPTAIHGR